MYVGVPPWKNIDREYNRGHLYGSENQRMDIVR